MHCKSFLRRCILMFLLFLLAQHGYTADTIRISIQDAQEAFMHKNMSLLAAHYNVSISEATEIQTRLLNNPELEIEGNLYNPERRKWIDVSDKTGDYKIGIQQLFPLAGKRRKLISIAKTNTNLAKLELLEVTRGLMLTLRSNFYEIHFLLKADEVLNYQISITERISKAFDRLQQQRNVTAAEALIAKSLFYSLLNEKVQIQNRLNELFSEIQVLLASPNQVYMPIVTEQFTPQLFTREALTDSALNNRPELKIARETISLHQLNHSYEKALSRPDLTAGLQYERRGGFVANATSFELGMAIPIFNRNQGNIKASKIAIEQSKLVLEQQKLTVEKEIETSFKKYMDLLQTLDKIDAEYFEDYQKMLQTMLKNYEKKYISIQELANFYESFKNNVTSFYDLQIQKFLALEELNYLTGSKIFN